MKCLYCPMPAPDTIKMKLHLLVAPRHHVSPDWELELWAVEPKSDFPPWFVSVEWFFFLRGLKRHNYAVFFKKKQKREKVKQKYFTFSVLSLTGGPSWGSPPPDRTICSSLFN